MERPDKRVSMSSSVLHHSIVSQEPEVKEEEEEEEEEDVKEGFKEIIREFALNTTVHGVPRIGASKNCAGRGVWSVVVIACFSVFCLLTVQMVWKYLRMEKIVGIELKFDHIDFPAVTLCNLNPYKQSMIDNVPELQRSMNMFKNSISGPLRSKREVEEARIDDKYVPVKAACDFAERVDGDDRDIYKGNVTENPEHRNGSTTCICSFHIENQDLSAEEFREHLVCIPERKWTRTRCSKCTSKGYCTEDESGDTECACNGDDLVLCLEIPERGMEKMWERFAPTTTESPLFAEAMGYADMTDELAITTKGKENLIFSMAQFPSAMRANLSYAKAELIHKCSFNGKQCDFDSDFDWHLDPTYGNCYIFNGNVSANRSSSRAGPTYGLRLLMYVNVSDYLATTEASGVRLEIHDQAQHPFPDTFGYSAPTGFVSSFGIRLKKVSRLPAPYGECIKNAREEVKDYIYDEHAYSPEGCYRSCFQMEMIKNCGCGDPLFPVPEGREHCKVGDKEKRDCLEEQIKRDFQKITENCRCPQPCDEFIYQVSFSISKWPVGASQFRDCRGVGEKDCVNQYMEHAAMVEIFYEQLNFEDLKESEAYGTVNLLADFGGQLGLWMGFSVITCMEVVVLIWDLILNFLRIRRERKEQKKAEEMDYREECVINDFQEHYNDMTAYGDLEFIDKDRKPSILGTTTI